MHLKSFFVKRWSQRMEENPIGLHLSFYTDDEGRCIARFRPRPEHQGYPGHLHGGLISTLLDEPTRIGVHFDSLFV